ncbi:MAG: TetR/AcrR family transcriptional regulator [Betaproteobacteria bacterium]|jgi:AcrR family transcriptional regulator|nr:TetR/AcrR family transcriptional regulator [Burkholderiaceae bacterium]MCZ8113043.1 TetR/AcrR family transcriptional regulator [Rubrivivax sp.]MCZ8176441.1 TetR/AcrR family transcriptional regulator [Burkholderiaceae bacterium]
MRDTTAPPTDLKDACVVEARALIAEQGIERLSLREVARRLGVSHQAPYKHHPSRDHLLAELIRRCFGEFAAFLDDRPAEPDAWVDLAALGERYLRFAAKHPLEYRLMFGTPWPQAEDGQAWPALVADAVHAFDVLRGVLRRLHGSGAAARARVDLDAMAVWSALHGLASITQADVMGHLQLAPRVEGQVQAHVMQLLGHALAASTGR